MSTKVLVLQIQKYIIPFILTQQFHCAVFVLPSNEVFTDSHSNHKNQKSCFYAWT